MAFTVGSILNKAYILLEDTNKVRWSEATLISFLNDALKELVKMKVDTYPVYVPTALVAGAKQTISSSGYYLLDILYNTNVAGTTQNSIPIRVKRATLDFTNPTWTQVTQNATVKYYAYETEDATSFYVYPPNTGTGYVLVKEAQFLPDYTTTGESIPLSVEFIQAIVYFICFSAFLMDTDTSNTDKVAQYKTLFDNQIALFTATDGAEEQKNAS